MLNTIFGWETPWGRRARLRAQARQERAEKLAVALHEQWKQFEAARARLRAQQVDRQATLVRAKTAAEAIVAADAARIEARRQQTLSEMRAARTPAALLSGPPVRPAALPAPAPVEMAVWPSSPVSREWDSTAPQVFKAGGGGFDGGGASGDWSRDPEPARASSGICAGTDAGRSGDSSSSSSSSDSSSASCGASE